MSCNITYNNQSLPEDEFSEKYIPRQGEIIEMESIEYRVHNSSRRYSDIVASQFADGSLIFYEDGDQEADRMINTADSMPVYNLDPVGALSVEEGGIDPIFDIPLVEMLKIGFKKTGKKFDWERYKNTFGEHPTKSKDLWFQGKGTEGSKASSDTIKKVKEWLKKVGVNLSEVPYISVNGEKVDANGVAKIFQALIEVVEGKQNVALTEEAMHFATFLTKEQNPILYRQMLNRIDKYAIYNKVFQEYKNKPLYQKDGKPDIAKIKFEAIGKLLAEEFIQSEEGTTEKPELLEQRKGWIQAIFDWVKRLFVREGNPFQEAIKSLGTLALIKKRAFSLKENTDISIQTTVDSSNDAFEGGAINRTKVLDKTTEVGTILSENDGTYLTIFDTDISGLQSNTGTFAYLALAQEAQSQGLTLRSDRITDRMSEAAKRLWSRFVTAGQAEMQDDRYTFTGNPNEISDDVFLQVNGDNLINKLNTTSTTVVNKPTGEGDNAYFIGAKQVKNRVTRFIKERFGNKFKDRKITASQKDFEDQMKEWGSKGHRDMQNLLGRYLTPEGRVIVENGKLIPQNNKVIYSELDVFNKGLFNQMHQYVQDLLLSYPQDTVFRLEQTIYSTNGGATGERDIAGTMDFMAILPTGKRDILDWKFTRVNTEQYDDIAWYKQNEWNLQMQEYKKILKRDYDIKDADFGKTRMVPFVLKYEGETINNKTTYFPENLEVGKVNLSIDEKTYLLPVVTPDESTGDEKLDSLVRSLTGLYNTIKDLPAPEHQKTVKNEQLNKLFAAIRHLQVARNLHPLTEQIGVIIKDTERVLKNHSERFETLTDLTEQQISDEATELLIKVQALGIYRNLDTLFSDFYGKNPTKEQVDILEELQEVVGDARQAYARVEGVINEFGKKYIASRRGVEDLLKEEKTVAGVTRLFGTTSELNTAAIETLFLMVDNANNKVQFDLREAVDELTEIKKEMDAWGGIKKALPFLKKGKENKLIDEFDPIFFDDLKKKMEEKDANWVKKNIDNKAFEIYLKERKEKESAVINETIYVADEEENEEKRREELQKLAYFTNPENPETYTDERQYYHLKKFPANTWHTKEYKELEKIPSLFKFYQFARKWNKKAREIHYLTGPKAERNFLPYLYKSFAQKIEMGGSLNVMDSLISGLIVDENVAGYGKYSPVTGQIENSIPTPFTGEIEDPSQVSENLVLNMAAYVKAIINYDYKSQIDGQVRALYFIEQHKEALQVQKSGNLIRVNGQVVKGANDKNSELFLNHMKSLQYGQKYTGEDTLLGDWAKNYNIFASKVNDKLGFKIIPKVSESLEGKEVSASRLMDSVNRVFTVKNMGLNIATAVSVYAGGNFQALINSGKYYTKSELLSSEFQHAAHKIIKSPAVHLALIKTFMPIDENLQREIDKLSATKINSNSFSELMMVFLRTADHTIQYANFLSFMKNTIVIEGNLYNAREYHRNSPEYANRINIPEAQRFAMESKFEAKVQDLINKHGLIKASTVDAKGNLKILSIDNIKNDNLFKYRTLITTVGRRATGNITPENEMLARMNATFRSVLVFKNWIPGLVKQRVGGLRHDAATDSFEYGRLRMIMKHLGPLAMLKIGNITDIIKGNDKGVNLVKTYYQKQKQSYKDKTDKELDMTEAEFQDMFRQSLRNQIKELGILVSMIGIVTAILPLFKPADDEEEEVKNRFKFTSRLLDKVKDEVWFYYNPVGLQQILNGSIFPALGIFTDAARVIQSSMTEIYAIGTGDEEAAKKNFVIKNIMKALPVTRELVYYIAMFDADLAKELGIKLTSQSRMK